jgi:predicted nucleotidyltransferase
MTRARTGLGRRKPSPCSSAEPDDVLVRLEGLVLAWPSSEARSWTRHFVGRFCSEPSVDAIVVIGSAVRGSIHERSDVDLIVIYHGEKPRFQQSAVDVDVLLFDRADVDRLIGEGNDLLGWSVRFGVAVCERDQFWTKVVRRWNDRLPLPSPDVARQRAEASRRRAQELLANGDQNAALELVVSMLTQHARSALSRAGIYPASRGELPGQLREIGLQELAQDLESAMHGTWVQWDVLAEEPAIT